MEELHLAQRILVDELRRGPQPGARLKQRLIKEFQRRGRRFSERRWNFVKFSDFLEASPELFRVEKPTEPGDITVSLVKEGAATTPANFVVTTSPPRVPRGLWQAFTNPDPGRQRYFRRADGTIEHFSAKDSASESARARVEASPADYVEIEFVAAADQRGWMRQFLDEVEVDSRMRDALQHLLSADYSSSVNHAFTAALPPTLAARWRRFRGELVYRQVVKWASQNSLDLDFVFGKSERANSDRGGSDGTLREALLRIIRSASDEELHGINLPAGLIMHVLDLDQGRR